MSVTDHTSPQSPNGAVDILLVEDNPGDVRLVREAFKETNGETELHVVTNGHDAITYLTRTATDDSRPLPELVLLDLNLPHFDGCEVLEALRDEPDLCTLPVLILTSSSDRDDVTRCYEAAANAYLVKPATLDEFTSIAASIKRFWFSSAELPPR